MNLRGGSRLRPVVISFEGVAHRTRLFQRRLKLTRGRPLVCKDLLLLMPSSFYTVGASTEGNEVFNHIGTLDCRSLVFALPAEQADASAMIAWSA